VSKRRHPGADKAANETTTWRYAFAPGISRLKLRVRKDQYSTGFVGIPRLVPVQGWFCGVSLVVSLTGRRILQSLAITAALLNVENSRKSRKVAVYCRKIKTRFFIIVVDIALIKRARSNARMPIMRRTMISVLGDPTSPRGNAVPREATPIVTPTGSVVPCAPFTGERPPSRHRACPPGQKGWASTTSESSTEAAI
jgi:hypothetical protein